MRSNTNKRMGLFMMSFLLMVFSACNTGDDRLREKATIEGEETARRQVEAENGRLRFWANEMEGELTKRHQFFEGVSGIYEGTMDVHGEAPSFIRIVLNPSIPRFPGRSRARTIEELSFELNNLNFMAQAVTWFNVGTGDEPRENGFGCTFEAVRPDLRLGKIFLVSENCNSTFTVYLSELDSGVEVVETDRPVDLSASLAERLMAGSLESVDAIVGHKQTNLSSRQFGFRLSRVAVE